MLLFLVDEWVDVVFNDFEHSFLHAELFFLIMYLRELKEEKKNTIVGHVRYGGKIYLGDLRLPKSMKQF